jgi:hypothetical protein
MKARYLLLMATMVGCQWALGETTLVIEAAAEEAGPWVQVPIGPEGLDFKGGILWQGVPAELKFVRVRVLEPVVQPVHVEPDEAAVPAVGCSCDACLEAVE